MFDVQVKMYPFDCAILGSHMATGQPSSKSDAREEKSLWTKRKREIVEVVAQEYRKKEVAQRFCISEQTVKNHMYNIFGKLGIGRHLELRSVPAFITRVELRSSRLSVLSVRQKTYCLLAIFNGIDPDSRQYIIRSMDRSITTLYLWFTSGLRMAKPESVRMYVITR